MPEYTCIVYLVNSVLVMYMYSVLHCTTLYVYLAKTYIHHSTCMHVENTYFQTWPGVNTVLSYCNGFILWFLFSQLFRFSFLAVVSDLWLEVFLCVGEYN